MKIQYKDKQTIVFESALFKTTSTLFFNKEINLLVDPNWLPNEIDFIYNEQTKLSKKTKSFLFFTHSDYDHIIGYGKFKANTKTIASKHFVENPNQSNQLEEIYTFDDSYYIKRTYKIEYPTIDYIIKEKEEVLTLGNDEYIFYEALGHNNDGLILYIPNQKILIVGDYLSNIEFPYIYHSCTAYRHTLNILKHIIETKEVRLLISGHGNITTNIREMNQRLSHSFAYLDELEDSVQSNKNFDTDALFKRYHFSRSMSKVHAENLSLAQREFHLTKP